MRPNVLSVNSPKYFVIPGVNWNANRPSGKISVNCGRVSYCACTEYENRIKKKSIVVIFSQKDVQRTLRVRIHRRWTLLNVLDPPKAEFFGHPFGRGYPRSSIIFSVVPIWLLQMQLWIHFIERQKKILHNLCEESNSSQLIERYYKHLLKKTTQFAKMMMFFTDVLLHAVKNYIHLVS